MDKDARGFMGGLAGNGWVAALLVAAGALVLRDRPLEGTRPASDEPRVEQRRAVQDVDARLWQDPFGAVIRAREGERSGLAADDRAAKDERRARPVLAASGVRQMVIAVMLPGGPYAENVESRRRTRYAVLAALNTANFAPRDTEHIGFFLSPRAVRADDETRKLPQFVPFEWFDSVKAPWRERESPMQVLVAWLDADGFSAAAPVAGLRTLQRAMSAQGGQVPWRVLGPTGSDGLGDILRETLAWRTADGRLDGHDLRFLSFNATVSDRVLLDAFRSVPPPGPPASSPTATSVHALLAERGVTLLRTIGTDKALAASLVDELELRGLKAAADRPPLGPTASRWPQYRNMCHARPQRPEAPHHIALVAEWDTLYGRSLRGEFMVDPEDNRGFCVNRFSYVRGLDGQTPEVNAAATGGTSKRRGEGKEDDARQAAVAIERAEGQGQYDYLRRLAAQLHERDRDLRQGQLPGAGIRAIGVVGNDIHDKLLVLQALQPEFPDVIFFTTDMDARYLHPREQDWARNLIVSSNFGLRLRDELQVTAPPFRDNYQTSAYFSTLLAIDDVRFGRRVTQADLDRWFTHPRILEIGRSAAFDFSTVDAVPPVPWVGEACATATLAACGTVHPPGSARFPPVSESAAALVVSALILVLWLPLLCIDRSKRRGLRRLIARGRTRTGRRTRILLLLALVVAVQVGLPWLLVPHRERAARWLTEGGKPISFSEGISIWPTEALHLLTLLLCVYLVIRGWAALTHNLDEISLALRLGRTRRRLVAEQDRIDRELCPRRRLADMFRLRSSTHRTLPTDGQRAAAEGVTPGTLVFWRFYIVQNRTVSRLVRCLACVVVVGLFGYGFLSAVHEWPDVPQRGELSARVHWTIALAAVVVMNFLVFYVADATLFCVRFVRDLRTHEAHWPKRSLAHFESRIGALPLPLLDHWIDLQFVARRTRCVTGLIYYPFIVLSLLLLSRSPVFDDWNMPPAVTLLALFSIAVVLGCAVALRRAAEASRRHALRDFRDALALASSSHPGQVATASQLTLLLRQIEDLREGAFAPFSQQPLLKAVLLPFATLGGTTLVDYLALANV